MAAISAFGVTQHCWIFHYSLQIGFNALHSVNNVPFTMNGIISKRARDPSEHFIGKYSEIDSAKPTIIVSNTTFHNIRTLIKLFTCYFQTFFQIWGNKGYLDQIQSFTGHLKNCRNQ